MTKSLLSTIIFRLINTSALQLFKLSAIDLQMHYCDKRRIDIETGIGII